MKKLIFTWTIFLTSAFGYSQDRKLGIAAQLSSPSKDDISLGWYNVDNESIDDYNLNHKSYALGLLLSFKRNDQTTFRLRGGMTKYYTEEYRDIYSFGTRQVDSNVGQQTKFSIAPGIVWEMTQNKLELYAGFELPITLHGQFTLNWASVLTDSLTGLEVQNTVVRTVLPKGHSFGLGAIMGFSYSPAKWISLGAEFSPSLLYAKLSGETESTVTATVPLTPPSIYRTNDEDKGFTYYETRFSINFSLWL